MEPQSTFTTHDLTRREARNVNERYSAPYPPTFYSLALAIGLTSREYALPPYTIPSRGENLEATTRPLTHAFRPGFWTPFSPHKPKHHGCLLQNLRHVASKSCQTKTPSPRSKIRVLKNKIPRNYSSNESSQASTPLLTSVKPRRLAPLPLGSGGIPPPTLAPEFSDLMRMRPSLFVFWLVMLPRCNWSFLLGY